MNFDNDEEALGFINRLLERLHQADFTNQGSKIQIVYVASGGQHVETQYISRLFSHSFASFLFALSAPVTSGGYRSFDFSFALSISMDEAYVTREAERI